MTVPEILSSNLAVASAPARSLQSAMSPAPTRTVAWSSFPTGDVGRRGSAFPAKETGTRTRRRNALRRQVLGIVREPLFFVQRRPAEAGGNRWPVIFALDHVLWAAIVEAEDLVVDVEPIHNKAQATANADAALSVELKLG